MDNLGAITNSTGFAPFLLPGHRLGQEGFAMKQYYITFRSVTFAQRGEAQLKKAGHRCVLQRTPRWMEEQGCGYDLRIWAREIGPVIALLQEENIPIRRVYLQTPDGELEEVIL